MPARSFVSQRPWSLSAVQPPTFAHAESSTTMCHQPRSYEYQVTPSGAAAVAEVAEVAGEVLGGPVALAGCRPCPGEVAAPRRPVAVRELARAALGQGVVAGREDRARQLVEQPGGRARRPSVEQSAMSPAPTRTGLPLGAGVALGEAVATAEPDGRAVPDAPADPVAPAPADPDAPPLASGAGVLGAADRLAAADPDGRWRRGEQAAGTQQQDQRRGEGDDDDAGLAGHAAPLVGRRRDRWRRFGTHAPVRVA